MSYAPAVSSCESINGVDACTVVAFDVIPAFVVPNPSLANVTWANPFSQCQPLRSHQCRGESVPHIGAFLK